MAYFAPLKTLCW